MAQLNPYLLFDGNCREAMTFYKNCLGGDLNMHVVGEMPGGPPMPPEAHGKILHAHLAAGQAPDSLVLMASDRMDGVKTSQGSNISLALHCTSEEQIDSCFAKLSAGGKVTFPLADQFWGARWGSLVDKFGIPWQLNFDKSASRPG
jgi:PhnB protein